MIQRAATALPRQLQRRLWFTSQRRQTDSPICKQERVSSAPAASLGAACQNSGEVGLPSAHSKRIVGSDGFPSAAAVLVYSGLARAAWAARSFCIAFCRCQLCDSASFAVICECPKHQGLPNSLQAIARFCQADAEPPEFSLQWLQRWGLELSLGHNCQQHDIFEKLLALVNHSRLWYCNTWRCCPIG